MAKPLVVITDHIFPSQEIERAAITGAGADLVVGACRTEDEVLDLAREADAVMTTYAPVTARVIAGLKRCRVIARYGVGVDNVAVDEATKRGIYVCNVPDYSVDEVSEHALALLLALARRVVVLNNDVKAGRWDYKPFRPFHRINGRTLGLIGLGRIARALGAKASALGLRLVAFDPYVPPDSPAAQGVRLVSLDELLAEADFISVHSPLTPETRGLIGRDAFQKMKPGAVIVNTARGGIIDEDALVEALAAGRIAGAGLDVLSQEPMRPDHPLLQFQNVVLTPHAAFYSEESTLELQRRAADEVVRSLTGQPQRCPVNKPVGR